MTRVGFSLIFERYPVEESLATALRCYEHDKSITRSATTVRVAVAQVTLAEFQSPVVQVSSYMPAFSHVRCLLFLFASEERTNTRKGPMIPSGIPLRPDEINRIHIRACHNQPYLWRYTLCACGICQKSCKSPWTRPSLASPSVGGVPNVAYGVPRSERCTLHCKKIRSLINL